MAKITLIALVVFILLIGGMFVWSFLRPTPQTQQENMPIPQKTLDPVIVPTNHEPSEHTDPPDSTPGQT